jgi:hypothetical protein
MNRPLGDSLPWRNWAGDVFCSPAAIEHPSSVAEISSAIARVLGPVGDG